MMDALLSALRAAVGPDQLFEGARVEPRYHTDLVQHVHSAPLCVVRPRSTAEVSAVLRAANAHGVPVTTQGGRTGTVGGAMADRGAIVLSLERMNAIEEFDPVSMTMTVGAGAVLQAVHEAAEAAGLFVPLDIGSRGTATIGGVISTNAGGLRAIRWGLARDMVLGLEAVLADGTIVTGIKKTIKDNAGYDWKHLMIGSEGTLGVVTRATLRLRTRPRSIMTAALAAGDFNQVVTLLRDLDADLGGMLTSFEIMWGNFYELITEANRDKRLPPMPSGHAFYVLVEAMGGNVEADHALFEKVLSDALERGAIADAVIAQSERERADIWAVREDIGAPMSQHWPVFAFDVSVALRDMPAVADEIFAGIRADCPDALILTYGHAGDGNLHFVIGVGDGSPEAEHRVDTIIYQAISRAGGSISAEHGIGRVKRDYLHFSRSPGELALMRTMKHALDPNNILNPGKVIDMTPGVVH